MDTFDVIFTTYSPLVFRYLRSLCGDAAVAEELTAETFYRAYTHFDSFRGDSKLETWLCAIAKNAYLKDCRRSVRTVGADAQVLFATDGRLHARVLALECDDFDAQRMKAIRHRANQKWNQQYHLSLQISISDSYTQFRLNLVLAARDNGELRSWVSTQPERLLQRAVPIVQAAVAREQGVLLFPALHQWVTPAEVRVYETAARLLTELFPAG